MFYCFFDTNILLQYQPFDEINWLDVLKAERVCLIISAAVIRQLDRFKDDPTSSRRRKRSRNILSKLDKYDIGSDKMLRENVFLRIQMTQPDHERLRRINCDSTIIDDQIVGAAALFSQDNPQDRVAVVADDYGVRFKAKELGIEEIRPPDNLRLEAESDPRQKENQELKLELARLQNAQPKLKIGFLNEENELVREITFQVEFDVSTITPEEVEQALESKRQELTYVGYVDEGMVNVSTESPESIARMLDHTFMKYPTEAQISSYEEKLEDYLSKYNRYLEGISVYESYAARTRPLYICIRNEGAAPADNVQVGLHFPDGLRLMDEEISQPESPTPPDMPKPRTLFDEYAMLATPPASVAHYFPRPLVDSYSSEPVDTGPIIRKTNSYEVEYSTDSLKHHDDFGWLWPPLYVTFEPFQNLPKVIEISYRVGADNIIKPIIGSLLIRVTQ
jgi:hypothetical protein